MSFFGVELNAQINRLNLEIRLKLAANRYRVNLRTLYRSFVKYDSKIEGMISEQNFNQALNQNGIFLKKHEVQAYGKAYGQGRGQVDWSLFLFKLRLPMNELRRQNVEEVFSSISQGNDSVAVQELSNAFHSDFSDTFRKVTKQEKMRWQDFLSVLVVSEGRVAKQEFIAFYNDFSVNFPDDQVFIAFVAGQWGQQAKKPEKIDQQKLKELIRGLRYKLIQKSNGTKDQFVLRKLFEQLDRNKNGSIGPFELDLLLKKLELPVSEKHIEPLVEHLDKNKSGSIEYEQFKQFLFFDPYPK